MFIEGSRTGTATGVVGRRVVPKLVAADHDVREVLINLAPHIPASSLRMMLPGAWRANDRLRRDATRFMAAATANVCDDEPLTRRELAAVFAAACGSAPPRLPPPWAARFMGSAGELLARSQRMSNTKLRAVGWITQDRSAREGMMRAFSGMAGS